MNYIFYVIQDNYFENNFEIEGGNNENTLDNSDYRMNDNLMNDNYNPRVSNLMMGLNNLEPQFGHGQESYEEP